MIMKLEQLKISGICEPMGYHLLKPVLSWKVTGAKGQRPVHASIDVTRHGDDKTILFHKEGADLKWEGTRLDLALCFICFVCMRQPILLGLRLSIFC